MTRACAVTIGPRMAIPRPLPWRHACRTTPMMPAMRFRPWTLFATLPFSGISDGVCRPAPLILPVLALGSAPLARPDAVSRQCIIPLVPDASPDFGHRGTSHATVWAWHVDAPRRRVPLADRDADDDDPAALAMRTTGAPGRPRATRKGSTGVTHPSRWRSRYLVRPQLLTRFSPLPTGRELLCIRPTMAQTPSTAIPTPRETAEACSSLCRLN
jgi:hypothetical protein